MRIRRQKKPEPLRTIPAGLSLHSSEETKTNLQVDYSERNPSRQDSFSDETEVKEKFAPKRVSSEKLAASYHRLEWGKKAHRVDNCGTILEFAHAIDGSGQIDPEGKLHNANFCRDRLCPMCNWRRSYKIFGQVSQVMEKIASDYTFLFLTLTVLNVNGCELQDTLDNMQRGWRNFIRHKRLKSVLQGSFRTLEITRNSRTGQYHPHFHVILAVSKNYFKGGSYIKQSEFLQMWRDAIDDQRICIVDIRTVKDLSGQAAEDAAASLVKGVLEITKYAVKDTDFLVEDENVTDTVVRELTEGLFNRNLCAFSGIFKKVRKELQLDDPEDGDLIHCNETINPAVAYLIVKYGWSSGCYKMTGTYLTENLGV